MVLDSRTLFNSELVDVIRKYHNLTIKDESGNKYIKGILDIPDDSGTFVRSFLVEIHCSTGFPCRFPILKEVGDELPSIADWHKYSDSSCCITVEADEILQCRNGITITRFIDNYAIPYFANQAHRLLFGFYKNGEYGHGKEGIFQFYSDILKTSDISKWKICLDIADGSKKLTCDRNDPCFCGSSRKFKNCHRIILSNLISIGLIQVKKDFLKIIA